MARTRPPAQLRPAATTASGLRRSTRVKTAPAPAAATQDAYRVNKSTAEPKSPRYDCTTCDRNLASSRFPKILPTDDCDHLINTCRACLKEWITVQMDVTTYDKLTCPECPQLMQNSDVLVHATKEVYKRFDELERKAIAEKVPGFRWCMEPKCKSGQVHEPLLDNDPKTSSTGKSKHGGGGGGGNGGGKEKESDSIFVCNDCGAKACVECDRPYHEGESCAQYQERIKGEAEAANKASLAKIKDVCKSCPTCEKSIERNGGCDEMTCSQCGTRFCWLCSTPYTVINQQGHGEGCVYAQPGRFDPHAHHAQAGFWAEAFGPLGGLEGPDGRWGW